MRLNVIYGGKDFVYRWPLSIPLLRHTSTSVIFCTRKLNSSGIKKSQFRVKQRILQYLKIFSAFWQSSCFALNMRKTIIYNGHELISVLLTEQCYYIYNTMSFLNATPHTYKEDIGSTITTVEKRHHQWLRIFAGNKHSP